MDKKVLTLRPSTAAVLADAGPHIKAIRVNRGGEKDGASLASGWSSSWSEGNVSQTPKLGLLVSENTKLAGERNSAIKNLESEKKRALKMESENARLREVNSQCISRIRKIEADNYSGLRKQEKSLKARYDQETISLNRRIKVLQENEKKQMRNIGSQQQQHAKACKEWEAQHSQMASRIEALELENKSMAAAIEAARCKQESEAGSREHVVVMLVVAGDKQRESVGACIGQAGYVDETAYDPANVDSKAMDKSGKLLEAIPELGSCESPHCSDKEAPVTPPISPGKFSQLNRDALDFDRPIPMHMSWADMVEDDSRWYEDSENEAEKVPAVNVEGTVIDAKETTVVEKDVKVPTNETSEEHGWLSRKGHGEFRAFRAFNHYRASSFDNSSKRVSKRSPRKSQTYQSQGSHNGLAKQALQTAPRHQRHKSMDKYIGGQSGDDSSPWPEWNGGTPHNYSNVQKVGSGVLVVNRKAPKSNAPATPPARRSKSDIPQCRRHLAGYCKFEDQCWFRHD